METLHVSLSPIDSARFLAKVSGAGGGEGSAICELPFGGRAERRAVLLTALELPEFRPGAFADAAEQDWLVEAGLLAPTRRAFAPDMLARIGQLLHGTLFPVGSNPRKLLEEAIARLPRRGPPLHLQIQIDSEAGQRAHLADYPWELMHDGRGFLLQRRVSISRYIEYGSPPPTMPTVERVQVLFVSSSASDPSKGLAPLTGAERRAVRRGLDSASRAGHIQVDRLRPATMDALRVYLAGRLDKGEATPHVIHFDGHGYFGRRCPNCRIMHSGVAATSCTACNNPLPGPQGFLLFEHPQHTVDYVSARELGALLQQTSLQEATDGALGVALVVLSACRSALAQGGESVFNGVAQSLIDSGVPAVVAMQFSVGEIAAAGFAEHFYRAIGGLEPLVLALSRGREAMGPEGNQWYRPALLLRWKDNEGGRLFSPRDPGRQLVEHGAPPQGTEPGHPAPVVAQRPSPDTVELQLRGDNTVHATWTSMDRRESKSARIADGRIQDRIRRKTDEFTAGLLDNRSIEIEDLGKDLYQALFVDDVQILFELALARRDGRSLRIALDVEPGSVAYEWPLELMYCASLGDFLGAHRDVSLYRRIGQGTASTHASASLRVLVVVSLPEGRGEVPTSVLDVLGRLIRDRPAMESVEVLGLLPDAVLGELPISGRTSGRGVTYLGQSATWEAIRDIGNRQEAERPQVLHFIGHGRAPAGTRLYRLLLNKDGGADSGVDECELGVAARMFEAWRPGVIILQGCEDADIGTERALTDLAGTLVLERRIPAAVATQARLTSAGAATFARGFYEALLAGKDVGQAVQWARSDVDPRRTTPAFGVPILLTYDPVGIITESLRSGGRS